MTREARTQTQKAVCAEVMGNGFMEPVLSHFEFVLSTSLGLTLYPALSTCHCLQPGPEA